MDVDLACLANRFGQSVTRDLAAQHVVRTDVGDGEGHRAIDVVAIADEGVVGDDWQTGVSRVLQWGYHSFLVHRSQEEEVQVATGHHRIQHWGLNRSIPLLRYLDDQLGTKVGGSLFRAALHGEVEGILHAGQETDLNGARFCLWLGFRCGFLGWLLSRRLFGSRFLGCGRWRSGRHDASTQQHAEHDDQRQQGPSNVRAMYLRKHFFSPFPYIL